MAEDNGRLNFSAYIDNSELQRSAQESKNILEQLGESAEKQGNRLDNAFNFDLSGLRAMSKEATDIFSQLGKEFDVSDVKHKIEALETVIGNDEEVVKSLAAKFDELGAKAREAFAEGNFGEFDALTLQMEETATQINEVATEAANYTAVLESMKVASGDAAATLEQTNQQEQQSSSVLITLLGGQEKYNTIISQMPEPLRAAAQGINGMTGAAKAFIATPLGAILAAVILALKTLKTWFDSTVEGQMAFAKVSGYVSGVLGQLKEIVIAVGKAIYNAFSNPKEAIVNLWNAIKENIVNRFKALGDMASSLGKILKSAFTFDVDGIKAGVKELGESFLQFGTGVENCGEKIGNWAKGVHEAATATADIKVAERELEIEVSKWQEQKEKLEQVKADARMKMYDTSLSADERKKALDAYKNALNQQVAQEKKFADRRIDLQKRTMALTSNTIEDENTLRDLQAARAKIDTQAANELAMLQRRANSITNPKGGGGASAEETAAKELIALQNSNRQAEIDAMEEGAQKKLAQIRFDYEREIAEIKAQEVKWKEAQSGVLSDDQKAAIQAAVSQAEGKRERGTALVNQEELKAALQDIQTYEQRRTEITEQYAKRRAALNKEDGSGLKEGVSEENLAELNRQEEQTLQALDNEFASREESFTAWCESIANMSLAQLESVLDRAKAELDALTASGEKDSKKLSAARAKVAKAQQAVNKANAKQNVGVEKRSIKEWEDLYKTLGECVREFDKIGDAVGGVAGEFIKTAGGIATSTLSMINGIVQLVNMSSAGMQGTATAAATAISTVEKASVILTVISAALSIAMAIVNLFNSDDAKQEQIEALQGRIDQLQWMLDNADIVRLQSEYGKAVDKVAEAYKNYVYAANTALQEMYRTQGIIGIITDGARIKTEALTVEAEKLAKAYANVKYSADKALGSAKYDEAKDQLENIAQQQILINEQIELEKSKKKTDNGAIEDWEKKIEELGKQAVDIINEIVEDIIGGSASDIASELGDAFFDAFQEGEDYAEAWGNKVNDIVSDVIKRMLISQFLEAPLGEIFDKYKAKWYKDGNFVGIDAIIESMSGFANDLNVVGDEFAQIWESLPDSVKSSFTVTSDAEREASEKGIAAASQDSIDELNGRMTAVQGHTYSIAENTKFLVANTGAILESVLMIERHTERLAAVESGIKTVKDTLNDIALKGIKIK